MTAREGKSLLSPARGERYVASAYSCAVPIHARRNLAVSRSSSRSPSAVSRDDCAANSMRCSYHAPAMTRRRSTTAVIASATAMSRSHSAANGRQLVRLIEHNFVQHTRKGEVSTRWPSCFAASSVATGRAFNIRRGLRPYEYARSTPLAKRDLIDSFDTRVTGALSCDAGLSTCAPRRFISASKGRCKT
jgi:hypothetical protein